MISSTLKVIGCLFAVCLIVNAQNPVKKIQTASISGKVTLKGNGLAGVPVGARPERQNGPRNSGVTVTTDQQGNYRMSNLVPGEYEVGPAAPQYVVAGDQPNKRFILAEGENLEGIDFTLIRGGAITGKVTDAEGRPIIEERIEIIGPEGPNRQRTVRLSHAFNVTDDRGVYRVYGLEPGKYKIAAGVAEDQLQFGGLRRLYYTQTFYPSTNDQSKATVIEVTEGGEATNIDITLRKSQPTFTVTGRIINTDTGKPASNVRIGLQKFRENGSSGTSGPTSNALGEIKLENLTPGKYGVYLDSSVPPNSELHAEPVSFEIVDQDITNLVLNAYTPGSVSGVIVMEGMDDKTRRSINALMIMAHVVAENNEIGFGNASHSHVNPDGSFTVRGMRAGQVMFSVFPTSGSPASQFDIARIERNGVVQQRLDIKDRERITGVRLILKSRSGSIQGIVKFENGQLPSASFVQAEVSKVGEENFGMSLQLDDRGRFKSSALAAGVYEVTVVVYTARHNQPPPTAKQQVVVADNQVSEVTLTVDLKQENSPSRP